MNLFRKCYPRNFTSTYLGKCSTTNFLLTQLNLKPIGFGQYQVTKITKNASGVIKSMEFSPNPRYYEKQIYLF